VLCTTWADKRRHWVKAMAHGTRQTLEGASAYLVLAAIFFGALAMGYGVHNPVDGLTRPVGPAAPVNLEATKSPNAG